MIRIATLGPEGTFSELAAHAYAGQLKEDHEVLLYPTITQVFDATGKECRQGVVPVENMIEGYIQLSLDLLLATELTIIHELLLPVQFSFVGNASALEEIRRVYVQFATQGQCRKFLESLPKDVELITTESNGASLEQAKEKVPGEGAIIPGHALSANAGHGLVIDDVTDYAGNRTRFIVLSKGPVPHHPDMQHKTSIVILEVEDRPGALYSILKEFAGRKINLTSIMSRPTKLAFGKYHFFIDIDGRYPEDKPLKAVIDRISLGSKVRILGSYPKAAAN